MVDIATVENIIKGGSLSMADITTQDIADTWEDITGFICTNIKQDATEASSNELLCVIDYFNLMIKKTEV